MPTKKTSNPTPDKQTIQKPYSEETSAPKAQAADKPKQSFPIVGIGASAGGLEALESFLENVPENSGMAFVIIQHLDPTRKGMMAELLQRHTSMPVVEANDRLRVEPEHIYVIPPNKDMSILRGALHLFDPVAPRGLRLPIDYFLRSLAADQKELSIGVILSGMGSDGTLGLRAIKEKAGVVFVQEPASAKFDGMPRSAIKAGLADVIAPVDALPDKILTYLQYVPLNAKPGLLIEDKSQSGLGKIIILLRSQTGHDFSLYKNTTLYRRIERRMGIHQIDNIATYVRFLQTNPQEVELLFHELLIGVTSFFRDPEVWEQLKTEVLPALLADGIPNQALRAWVPACSTGEEAYSLAILFKEALEELKLNRNISLQIFATDLDEHAIEKARTGIYPENISADLTPKRLDRYFVKTKQGYQISKSIREMIIFAPQNIVMDPSFTKLDLLSCRNLLIYMTSELQKKLLPLFHYSLKPGGFLLLGSAETIGNFTNLFAPLDGKTRLYRRLEAAHAMNKIDFPSAFSATQTDAVAAKPQKSASSLQTLTDELLLQKYSPAAVLTNDKGDILYISGRTGKYLEPAAGKANWNIFSMAREGLGYVLTSAFQNALRKKETVNLEKVIVGTNGGKRVIDVAIEPIQSEGGLGGTVLVVFTDVAMKPQAETGKKSSKVTELQQELTHARKEVQGIREEMQSSQEELKSANEEMQSTNEELQSTNEELTTSKEELQSMNEELHTVNQELQTRLDELSRTSNDMKNLLDSTDIATLFLDNSLCVRRFSSETSKITKLIPTDVGRPVTDIASALLYPELTHDAREVLRTLVKTEKQIKTVDGDWFSARILPYRTLTNMIDGVVITFLNITSFKNLEAKLQNDKKDI